MSEKVNHPSYYGGADNPYERIKVIDAWELDFSLGTAVKYIARAGKKKELGYDELSKQIEDIEKRAWYVNHEIEILKRLRDAKDTI